MSNVHKCVVSFNRPGLRAKVKIKVSFEYNSEVLTMIVSIGAYPNHHQMDLELKFALQ